MFSLMLLAVLSFPGAAAAQEVAGQAGVIAVDAAGPAATLNPLLFGQNVLFAGQGFWNPKTGNWDPEAEALAKKLAPTIIRFPGGGVSDFYFWEDGLGYRTTEAVMGRSPSITLEGSPPWEMVNRARIKAPGSNTWSDPFTFMVLKNRLVGIMGLQGAYPAGSAVRLERRPGQPDWFSHTFGALEFMKSVRSLGAQAIITVNYGTGLTKEGGISPSASLSQKVKRAAAWVAFMNGSPGDNRALGADEEGNDWRTVGYWASRRASLGHPEPFRVLYWEVGNEVYSKDESGFVPADKYGRDFLAFAKEMKAVDPAIKLGAVGLTFPPRGRGDADARAEWNPTVLKLAGEQMDFFILHPYYPGGGQSKGFYKSGNWFTGVMAGTAQAMADLREIRSIMNAAVPGRQVGLALTEYGIWPIASQEARDYSNLARALYDADLLLGMIGEASNLGIILANAWNLHGSNQTAYIGYNWSTGKRSLRPQYYAQELLVKNIQPRILETKVTSPDFATVQVFNVLARAKISVLAALASLSQDKSRLTLFVINRSLTAAVKTTIRIQGFTPKARAAIRTLGGGSAGDHNEDAAPAVVPLEGALDYAAPEFPYTFKAHSLTVLEFQAKN
ncbi:MAG: hypothetical protein C4567_06175 [Deltaproteobacteria bacterium]|nr:MAG: hypothetical protein C4567_06175 [Deltaproteobacteria bacterium]